MSPRAASLLVLAAALLSRAEAVVTCPTQGSTGTLKCLVGQLGTQAPHNQGDPTVTYSVSTPGNMVSETFPAGSICLAKTQETGVTVYANSTVADCADVVSHGNPVLTTACVTDNCAGTAGTGTVCPATSTATSCSVGLSGPAAIVTTLGNAYSDMASENPSMIVSPTAPKATTVPANTACITVTVLCQNLVLPGIPVSTECPSGQTLSIMMGAPAISAANDEGSCNEMLQSFSLMNFSTFVACGTNNCNAPTAATYVSASATLGGYTTTTFGTKEVRDCRDGCACPRLPLCAIRRLASSSTAWPPCWALPTTPSS